MVFKVMNYSEKYEYFYSKYYDKAEYLIKLFLIKSKSKNKNFGYSLMEIRSYLSTTYGRQEIFLENSKLIDLHEIFQQRFSIYEKHQVQEIFSNQILEAFQKSHKAQLPISYTYSKLIREVALVELIEEILRLLTTNSSLLQMFYELNNFENFEIRYYDNLLLQHYPIYKKMNLLFNPTYFENLQKEEDKERKLKCEEAAVFNIVKPDFSITEATVKLKQSDVVKFNPNEWNEKCYELFNYLINNYTSKNGKTIKYINIWYFLKRNVDKDKYTFSYSQEKYVIYIKENFNVRIKKFAKAEFDFDEQKSILSSLEQQFNLQKSS